MSLRAAIKVQSSSETCCSVSLDTLLLNIACGSDIVETMPSPPVQHTSGTSLPVTERGAAMHIINCYSSISIDQAMGLQKGWFSSGCYWKLTAREGTKSPTPLPTKAPTPVTTLDDCPQFTLE